VSGGVHTESGMYVIIIGSVMCGHRYHRTSDKGVLPTDMLDCPISPAHALTAVVTALLTFTRIVLTCPRDFPNFGNCSSAVEQQQQQRQ
jgi:hypothetical protein